MIGHRSLHGSSANIRRAHGPCTQASLESVSGTHRPRRHNPAVRSTSLAQLTVAAFLGTAILASDTGASDRIPGPPLTASGAAAPGFCPARGGGEFANAAGFGLAALAAALLLGRPSRPAGPGTRVRDAD